MLNVPTLLKHLQLIDFMQFTYYPDISRVTIFYYINKVAGYISDYRLYRSYSMLDGN